MNSEQGIIIAGYGDRLRKATLSKVALAMNLEQRLLLLLLSPTLCDPIDSSPTGSPVPGILQARILEWVAISIQVWMANSTM